MARSLTLDGDTVMVCLKVRQLPSWSHLVRQSLDVAIARVAEKEYHRLSSGISPKERLNRVTKALESMDGLGKGNEPEYNEWDALFYLTWYQPRHINLALAIVRHFFSGNSLHVIDVGCGALAVQIAAAISTAEKRPNGSKIKVTVQGIDPSEPMRRIGETVWLEFWSIVDENPHLSYLSQVCNIMTDSCDSHDSKDSYYCSTDAHIGSGSSSAECWLMAVHAVYESNKHSLRDILANIRRKSAPMLEVVTCPKFKVERAREVVTSHSRKLEADKFAGKGFDDEELCEITAWRKRLLNSLPQQPHGIAQNFLKGSVSWNPRNNPIQNDFVFLHHQGRPFLDDLFP